MRGTESERAAGLGAVLARGDLGDVASLGAALDGARAVFSVQPPDPMTEARHGRDLVEAARTAKVEQFAHTSVSGAGTVDVESFRDAAQTLSEVLDADITPPAGPEQVPAEGPPWRRCSRRSGT